MKDETDNGYKNHETFLIAMDINSNNGLPFQNYWLGKAAECIDRPSGMEDYNPEARLAGMLDCHYDQKQDDGVRLVNKSTALPLLGKVAVLGELLTAARARVDWMEIAKELIERVHNDRKHAAMQEGK